MRLINVDGRLAIARGHRAIDVRRASRGLFPSNPQAIFERWPEFYEWAAKTVLEESDAISYSFDNLGPVSPRPPQVFGIGLNYAVHAEESGFAVPADPIVFTKFVSSLAGPYSTVELPGTRIDWEAELVVVIGVGGRDINPADGWSHVAGVTVGQDLSDRDVQFWGQPPQFSLGKSRAGFAPIGPWLVTLDEVRAHHDPDDLRITSTLIDASGEERELQNGQTRDLIFPVPELIARLSRIVELLPGDVIFTGTPDGVGVGLQPAEFLRPGQRMVTSIEGIGSIRQRFVEPVTVHGRKLPGQQP